MRKDLNLLKFKDISVSSTSNQKMGIALLAIVAIAIIGLTGFIYVTTSSSLKTAVKKRDGAKAKSESVQIINNASKIQQAIIEAERAKAEKEKWEKLLGLLSNYDSSITICKNYLQYFMITPEKDYLDYLGLDSSLQRKILKINNNEIIPPTNNIYESSYLSFKSYREEYDNSKNEYIFMAEFELGGIYLEDYILTPNAIDEDDPNLASNIYKCYLEKLLKKGKTYNVRQTQKLNIVGGSDGKYEIILHTEVRVPMDKYNDFITLFNSVKENAIEEFLRSLVG